MDDEVGIPKAETCRGSEQTASTTQSYAVDGRCGNRLVDALDIHWMDCHFSLVRNMFKAFRFFGFVHKAGAEHIHGVRVQSGL